MAQIVPKLPLSWKGIFFVNSLLLWCNPIIPYFKAFREWIMTHNCLGHKVVWFWPKLCPNCTIVLKEDFWGKTDQYKLCQSIVSHHAKIFQNKLYGRSRDLRWISFRANWTQIVLLLENVFFFRKLPNSIFVYLLCPIMLQSLKKGLSVGQIMRYKVLHFWKKLNTNYRFTLKGFFF